MKNKPGDIISVRSFALADDEYVRVKLIKRMLKSKDSWGADGWDAQVIYKKDVDKLIKHGVPYKKKDKPLVWVFDFQIVNK
jgi:hypothetical protein